MIKKSIVIYSSGFIFGALAGSLLILTFPWVYFAFLELLIKKIEMQSTLVKGMPSIFLTLVIIANNATGTIAGSFGGYILSKIYLFLSYDTPSSILRKLAFFDKGVEKIPREHLKYYLVLHIFPTFVLFANGLVLGTFFVFYIRHLGEYFDKLYPHAIFEIPAIILSGAIGLKIAKESSSLLNDFPRFKRKINSIARDKLSTYSLVVMLLIIAGFLESM